ncbi:MAG TPA: bile acid:sodium symporter family protein [Solimonas sp.]
MQENALINIALPLAIAIVMCGIGLHLRPADFRRIADHPRSVAVGLIGHYVLLPALGFGVAWAFRMPPELAIGLVLVTACPSGNMSNTLTFLARGNVALAISLSVISAVATFASIPLLVHLAGQAFAGEGRAVQVPILETVRHLAGILLIPIAIGMAVRAWAPALADRLGPWVGRFAIFLLATLIGGIAITQRAVLPAALAQAGPAVMTLCCLAIGFGYLLARVTGLPFRDRLTVSLEVGVQNAALAILIALSVLKSAEIAVPGALYGVLMYLPALVVVIYGRRHLRRETVTGA